MKPFVRAFFVFLVGMALGVGAVLLYVETRPVAVAGPTSTSPTSPLATAPSAPQDSAPRKPATAGFLDEEAIASVYEKVSPAVVNIAVTNSRRVPDLFFPQQGTGSGFVVDKEGHIITNYHVVKGAGKISVTFSDGTTAAAEIVGSDPLDDLAVIKVRVAPDKLTVAPLGDSGQLRVGQIAIAIGSPFGLERTATAGIISSLGRARRGESRRLITNMVQTDAPINPGNSGGPLLNSKGEVIAINTMIESPLRGSVGIGFAVPINTAKRYLPDMIAGKEVQHPWLGISANDITSALVEEYSLEVKQGVLLIEAAVDGPAAKAGLRGGSNSNPARGDIITAIDGRPVRSVEDITSYLDTKRVGDTVTITFIRQGQSQDAKATLAKWPEDTN